MEPLTCICQLRVIREDGPNTRNPSSARGSWAASMTCPWKKIRVIDTYSKTGIRKLTRNSCMKARPALEQMRAMAAIAFSQERPRHVPEMSFATAAQLLVVEIP
jgi:hypothetical protein